ncbi:MAG: hypothetical protein AB7S99_00190 [Pseudodonghicola sp.]
MTLARLALAVRLIRLQPAVADLQPLAISEKTTRIEAPTKTTRKLAETTDTARRLQTMPGVDPMACLGCEGTFRLYQAR